MSRRHPSRRRLEQWLEGEDRSAELDAHVTSCDRCADIIEELAAADDPIQSALHRVLAPPDGLQLRVEAGIEERLQNRADMGLLADLMGVGLQAVRLLLDSSDGRPDIPPADDEGHAR